MSRDPVSRLEDIIEAGRLIGEYLQGYDYDLFVRDRRTIDAVTRNLEIVGEAVKNLPEEMTLAHPEVPWRAIAGFRDVLAHCYFRADDAIVWDAAKHHIDSVTSAARELLGQ